jgi:hypothetical protein
VILSLSCHGGVHVYSLVYLTSVCATPSLTSSSWGMLCTPTHNDTYITLWLCQTLIWSTYMIIKLFICFSWYVFHIWSLCPQTWSFGCLTYCILGVHTCTCDCGDQRLTYNNMMIQNSLVFLCALCYWFQLDGNVDYGKQEPDTVYSYVQLQSSLIKEKDKPIGICGRDMYSAWSTYTIYTIAFHIILP